MNCAKVVNDAVQKAEKNGFKIDRETLDNLKIVVRELEGEPTVVNKNVEAKPAPEPKADPIVELMKKGVPAPVPDKGRIRRKPRR